VVRTIFRLHEKDPARLRFLLPTRHAVLSAVARNGCNPVEVIRRLVAAAMRAGEISHREPNLMAMR
jgi:hypothetical protein